MSRQKNLGVSKETFSLTLGGRLTIPLAIARNTPLQPKGSMIYDPLFASLFYSDGVNWIRITDSTTHTQCIVNEAGDTSVCTDTEPPTDSKTIYFTTDAVLRAIFQSTGAFVATAGSVDPTTVIVPPGESANFQGNVSITGNLTISIPLAAIYGGTGQNTYTTGDTIYASGVDTLSKLPIGAASQVYTVSGGIPSWQDPDIVQTGPETPNTQANSDTYQFLPVNIDGNARFIPLTTTSALNSQNNGTSLICMGTNVCGGVSGIARTKLQTSVNQALVMGRNSCSNWDAAANTPTSFIAIGGSSCANLGAAQSKDRIIVIGQGALQGTSTTRSSTGSIYMGSSVYGANQAESENVIIGDLACGSKPTSVFDNTCVKIGSQLQRLATQAGGARQILIGAQVMSSATCIYSENNGAVVIGYGSLGLCSGRVGFRTMALGASTAVSTNFGAVGDDNMFIGGGTLAGTGTVTGIENTVIGGANLNSNSAGLTNGATIIGARCFAAVVTTLPSNFTCIGSRQTGTPLASELMIGRGCVAAGVTGRLSFGNAMEAIAATATAGAAALPAAPSGFLVISHNGTIRKIPVYAN